VRNNLCFTPNGPTIDVIIWKAVSALAYTLDSSAELI
jgi:hypothetical protein